MHVAFRPFGLLLLSLLLFGVAACRIFAPGVLVEVRNESGLEIQDLEVAYTGGVLTTTALKHGGVLKRKIIPHGESSLAIGFTLFGKERQTHKVEVYFEPNYTGRVVITIGAKGQVAWKDEIRI
ncbi:MAG: hypothetical protein ACK45B_10190 [Limisphaerales bacterium]